MYFIIDSLFLFSHKLSLLKQLSL